MRSSEQDLRERAEAVVARMAAHLDEDHLALCIDEPIDQAAADFDCPDDQELSFQAFHSTAARFVSHLYAHGLPCPRVLSASQARDEAVALLENLYQGTRGRGFDTAFVEALAAQPHGLMLVLGRLTEALKARERWMRTQWVSRAFFDPQDWELRCEIASILLAHYRSLVPDLPVDGGGAQFADEIPDLLDSCLKADLLPRRIATSPFSFVA